MTQWATANGNYWCAFDGTHLIKAGDRCVEIRVPGVERVRRLCAACGPARFPAVGADPGPSVVQEPAAPSSWASTSTLADRVQIRQAGDMARDPTPVKEPA